ncbi:hypothetical protein JKP75_14495 [Blastococcus sp. TML/M2B]|uniref:hypothetical protein n=1 Tax=Blastococcus sp. TML/M2B TaxID=2798727 RepID=UPI00190ADE5B|nr:hypothetical protein [Blastococcus sp. TML/M2B]MBN1093659.1 hypothetical protein [Blastococcus sp. TML/M2B]
MAPVRAVAVLLLLALAACAEPSPVGSRPPDAVPPRAQLPADPGALVLRVEQVGMFTTPQALAARLPVVSVYSDGRVVLQGPVATIWPAFAWPNVQVLDVGAVGVQELADRALAAGVAEQADLGVPPLADVGSTRFTLGTASGTHVREVYALQGSAAMTGSGLTADQVTARERLQEFVTELSNLVSAGTPEEVPRPWTPAAVAAVAQPWTASEEDVAQGWSPEPVPCAGPAVARGADRSGHQLRRRDRGGRGRRHRGRTGRERAHAVGHPRRCPVVGGVPTAAARRDRLRRPDRLTTSLIIVIRWPDIPTGAAG